MSLTRARAQSVQRAITAIFFIQGIVGITQIPRIPELIDQVHANFAIWGLITGLSGLGGMLGLLRTPQFIARFGTKNVTIFGGIGQAAMTTALIFAHDPVSYLIFAAAGSLCGSLVNIALNSQSVALQKAMNKVILGRFHASWSIGATTSAILSGILATFMPLWIHLILIPGIGIVLLLIFGRELLQSSEDGHGAGQAQKKTPFFRAPGQVWLLAAGLFTSVFGEIAMIEWSAVYAKNAMLLDIARGAIPYAAFSGAMIVARLLVGRLTKNRHFSDVARVAGITAGLSLGIGVLAGAMLTPVNPDLALIAVVIFFAIAGLGAGPTVPSFFSAAGYVKGMNTAQVLARMSFVNTVVIIGAKFVMGLITQGAGIATAFIFPSVTFVIAGILAGIVAKRAKADEALVMGYPATGAMNIVED